MGVSVNGSPVDTVTAVGVGRPLQWVQNTVTFTASSATSQIEFDDTTPSDQIQGPTLDNVSLTAVPDVVIGEPRNHRTTGDRQAVHRARGDVHRLGHRRRAAAALRHH